jgi:hypothetical protein
LGVRKAKSEEEELCVERRVVLFGGADYIVGAVNAPIHEAWAIKLVLDVAAGLTEYRWESLFGESAGGRERRLDKKKYE